MGMLAFEIPILVSERLGTLKLGNFEILEFGNSFPTYAIMNIDCFEMLKM